MSHYDVTVLHGDVVTMLASALCSTYCLPSPKIQAVVIYLSFSKRIPTAMVSFRNLIYQRT
jgi:hypothetical protein